MKKIWFVLLILIALMLGPSALAAEHHFGLRVGNTNFGDPQVDPTLSSEMELLLRFSPPGCVGEEVTDGSGELICPGSDPLGGPMKDTGELLNDAIHIDEVIDGRRTQIDFRRDFDAAEFEGNFIGFVYEFRRDADSRFSLAVDGGVFSTDATHTLAGNAYVNDPNIDFEDPGDFDSDNHFEDEDIPALITNRLEYSLYYFHISGRYSWTPGKWRLWGGVGIGLWANLWREVVEAEFLNLACLPAVEPGCNPKIEYRESQGDRRTIIPLSASVGATWQFLPHWSVHVESRYLFLAEADVTLFETAASYDIGGNQFMLGFSYKL